MMNWVLIVQAVLLFVAIMYTFIAVTNIFLVAASWLEGPTLPILNIPKKPVYRASFAWAMLFVTSNL